MEEIESIMVKVIVKGGLMDPKSWQVISDVFGKDVLCWAFSHMYDAKLDGVSFPKITIIADNYMYNTNTIDIRAVVYGEHYIGIDTDRKYLKHYRKKVMYNVNSN